jgi:poly(A) polymerase Pap1
MAGNLNQWPAMAVATAAILALKVWNNRKKVLAWPMEFLLFAAVTMIVVNLAWLYFFDLPV